jgi:hypothetical protein
MYCLCGSSFLFDHNIYDSYLNQFLNTFDFFSVRIVETEGGNTNAIKLFPEY